MCPYFGKDAIDNFLNDMIKESEYCSKVTETKFDKTLGLTEKDHDDLEFLLL